MNGFIESFQPLLKKLKKFKIEIVFLLIAFFITVISLVFYIREGKTDLDLEERPNYNISSANSSQIIVDIAGAVEKPGVYETTSGARLKDLLMQAGGLSADAEKDYVSRNFNLAKIIVDQEKIYFPSHQEIVNGIFIEPQKALDYTAAIQNAITTTGEINDQKISINTGTLEELDRLPGIGKITAEKILQNRPYKTIEELLNRKILKKNIYENVKNLIEN